MKQINKIAVSLVLGSSSLFFLLAYNYSTYVFPDKLKMGIITPVLIKVDQSFLENFRAVINLSIFVKTV